MKCELCREYKPSVRWIGGLKLCDGCLKHMPMLRRIRVASILIAVIVAAVIFYFGVWLL